MRARGRRFVHVERLRIEPGGERLDLVRREGVAAEGRALAHRDLFEIFHRARPDAMADAGVKPRRAIIIVLTKVIT